MYDEQRDVFRHQIDQEVEIATLLGILEDSQQTMGGAELVHLVGPAADERLERCVEQQLEHVVRLRGRAVLHDLGQSECAGVVDD